MAEKYCEKHNQFFMEHVLACPICIGEKILNIPERKQKKFKRKKITNKISKKVV